MKSQGLKILRRSDGLAMVELALILPVLLILVFGIFEYSRFIQAKNIIVNMSRECANLISRSQELPQTIMDAIARTAEPLTMGTNGMICITEVTGIDNGTGTVEPVVSNQFRYVNGGYTTITSKVWNGCGDNWNSDGACTNIIGNPAADLEGDGAGTYSGVELGLDDQEKLYAVEVFYNYVPIVNYVMKNNIELYSRNVF